MSKEKDVYVDYWDKKVKIRVPGDGYPGGRIEELEVGRNASRSQVGSEVVPEVPAQRHCPDPGHDLSHHSQHSDIAPKRRPNRLDRRVCGCRHLTSLR